MQDKIKFDKPFAFDENVTSVFEDMLSRSVPQYDVMRDAVTQLSLKYVKPNTDILDLGASIGGSIDSLIRKFGAHNRFVLCDNSEPMIEKLKHVFAGYITSNIVSVNKLDLRKEFPCVNASLILSVLTLQFIPIEYRQGIIKKIYDSLLPGSAFIFVEKILGESYSLNEHMIDIYYQHKKNNNYSEEEIQRKKLALEGVLVPITHNWNIDMLKSAGFKNIDTFWRWFNFAGFIAIK